MLQSRRMTSILARSKIKLRGKHTRVNATTTVRHHLSSSKQVKGIHLKILSFRAWNPISLLTWWQGLKFSNQCLEVKHRAKIGNNSWPSNLQTLSSIKRQFCLLNSLMTRKLWVQRRTTSYSISCGSHAPMTRIQAHRSPLEETGSKSSKASM